MSDNMDKSKSHTKFQKAVLIFVFSIMTISMVIAPLSKAFATEFVEGVEYVKLSSPISIKNQTEADHQVIEMFWYGCPHCFRFEPTINAWKSAHADSIEVIKVPAIFNKRWAFHARLFYTVEELGILDEVHQPIFDAIHVDDNPLTDADAAAAFLKGFGVEKSRFMEALNSFSVDFKVRRAQHITEQTQIRGVPSLIVDGKYRTSGNRAGSRHEMLQVVEDLTSN